jgi:hypothetical protein
MAHLICASFLAYFHVLLSWEGGTLKPHATGGDGDAERKATDTRSVSALSRRRWRVRSGRRCRTLFPARPSPKRWWPSGIIDAGRQCGHRRLRGGVRPRLVEHVKRRERVARPSADQAVARASNACCRPRNCSPSAARSSFFAVLALGKSSSRSSFTWCSTALASFDTRSSMSGLAVPSD